MPPEKATPVTATHIQIVRFVNLAVYSQMNIRYDRLFYAQRAAKLARLYRV